MTRQLLMLALCLAAIPARVAAQEAAPECRLLCAPEFKFEPTITFTNIFGAPRLADETGRTTRERRERDFEIILSMDLPTRMAWLGFTVEAIFVPFDRESTPELEFEANLTWLPSSRTGGWISSHVDIIDKFSSAERPGDRRAYTHKLNLELDTGVAIFHGLAAGRWLRGVEFEASIDFVATGLPRRGDRIGHLRYVDNASPWSLSLVVVVPVAPF